MRTSALTQVTQVPQTGFALNGPCAEECSAMAEDRSTDERRFEAAVKVMRSLPEDGTFEPSDEMLAMFYSYYKQATVGPCNTTKPNGWDTIGKAKWEAWKALGEMTKEQAMKEYVQEIQLILETIPVTEEVGELLDELDPFYEVVDNEDEDVTSKPAILAIEAGISDEEPEDDEDGGSFDEDGEDDGELEDDSEDVLDMIRSAGARKAKRESSTLFNGSAEVSSLTNGTHSSLNTEEEEEELACSQENSLDSPDGHPCTDYISDEASEQKQQSDDPDCDIYSDSVEHPAPVEGSGVSKGLLAESGAFGARRPEEPRGSQDGKRQGFLFPVPVAAGPVQSERSSVDRGRERHLVVSQTCDPVGATPSGLCVPQAAETGPGHNKRSVNAQIASALSRLQKDMKNVLQRLNTLEALTAAQDESFPPERDLRSASGNKFHWWPLDTSPIAVALALIWPFAVNWLVQLYLQRKRRRIK
ncbi:acyl-CoA-binding domain-containing protein 5-B isoform X2 [Salminus brasiliensis]|uniref:acyl-CoA-binding domain-containing protein 5-B isoform X2 n=1 Tax=Salminus brasiliensis TaxID=930266 RepID=UPI003B833514